MNEPIKSRLYLKLAIGGFVLFVIVATAVAWYRYDTPQPEQDIEAARQVV